MQDSSPKSRLELTIQLLNKHGVKFIVIGGQAEYLFGSPRVTYDIDLCYDRSAANLKSLAAALNELKPTLRGVPPGIPLILDERALAFGSNYTFDTPMGAIDFLGYVEPIGAYSDLLKKAAIVNLDGLEVRVIDLDDLIRIKEHIGRSKDRESLFQLYAIRRLRNDQNSLPDQPS